jgi:4-amino-4-deoxy-L-arabinose transferase-like glycosyltransferase
LKTVKQIWYYSLIIKVVLAILLPLSHDETYYWVWSHHLQLSYFDHPAMVSWIFWLGHFLEPFGNAVRLPSVLMGHLSLLFWISIIQKYFDLERAKSWLFVVLACPLLGVGSIVVTPDIPLIFFWSAAIYFFLRFIESQKMVDCWLLGASLGLGFCSKYHIILFVPIALTYMQFEKKWALLKFKNLFVVFIAGLALSSPVLIWNYMTNFASFRFQLAHGLERPGYEFESTLSYVFGQVMLLFPIIFWSGLRARLQNASKFIFYAAWGPLLFFFLTSFRALVEANWPIAAYPAVILLAITTVNFKKITRQTCLGWGVLYVVIGLIMLIPNLKLTARLKEPAQFILLVPLVRDYKPLYASSYQMASSLWYATKTPVYKLQYMTRPDFYDTLSGSKPSENLFYVVKPIDESWPAWINTEHWATKKIKEIDSHFVLVEVKRL